MGKLAVYKYVSMMILVVQLIVTAYTFLGLFGGDVSPIGNSARAMVVYILPILIVLNLICEFLQDGSAQKRGVTINPRW